MARDSCATLAAVKIHDHVPNCCCPRQRKPASRTLQAFGAMRSPTADACGLQISKELGVIPQHFNVGLNASCTEHWLASCKLIGIVTSLQLMSLPWCFLHGLSTSSSSCAVVQHGCLMHLLLQRQRLMHWCTCFFNTTCRF